MLKVMDMSAVARKVLDRLEAEPSMMSITVVVGWNGDKICANLGSYRKVIKSLPSERVTVSRGATFEEAENLFAIAVARLQMSLSGKLGGKRDKAPSSSHGWRATAKKDAIARQKKGD